MYDPRKENPVHLGSGKPVVIESGRVNCKRPLMAVTEMIDCGRWVCLGQRQGFCFDPRTRQKIDFTHLTVTLEPPGRANKVLINAIQEISAKKRANVEARDYGTITDTERLVKIMGCDPFRWPGFSPSRLEDPTNNLENNLEQLWPRRPRATRNYADERGESGGMRARPQPRKPSTDEVGAHVIDHYPFRSWCRCFVMAAAMSGHHRRQAEDYNEVPAISSHYGCFADSKDDADSSQKHKQWQLVPRPILVIQDMRSKVIHADRVLCKGMQDEFPIETTTKWSLGLGFPEVIIRTDGESSIVALGRGVGENSEKPSVKAMQNASPASDRRSVGHAESGFRIVTEMVRTLVCYARELHGVTVGTSHVSLPWCVRFAARIISRFHRGTDGMTGYRRAYGRSRVPRRYVPWSEKSVLY